MRAAKVNCGSTFMYLWDAYKEGMISEETITESVVRLYTTRFLLGLFDETEYDDIPYETVECREHLELSCQAACESIVLLKNNGLLPLKKEELKTVGVIGPNANSRAALIGNYHGTASEYVTVLEGLQRYLGDQVRVLYSEGCDIKESRVEHLAMENDRISEAMIVAEHSDVVILVVGLNENLEGEEGDEGNNYASGDKDGLELPMPQRELMRAVAETGKPVVLCMMAGSDMDLSFANENFDAILQLWYPGARGGEAAAKILFGDVSPSGKLCVTFYDGLEGLPDFEDYSMKGRTYRYLEREAQYPFGYGLTYGKVRVREAHMDQQDPFLMHITYQNEGERDTQEVLQVYVENRESAFAPMHPRLCGFARVTVRACETGSASVRLDPHTYTVITDQGLRVQEGRKFVFYAGCSQPDEVSCRLLGTRPVEVSCCLDEK